MARVLAVAGEASGDALLAPVVARLRARGHDVLGAGGDRCAAAGMTLLAHARDLTGHGLTEAVHTLPALARAWARLGRVRADAGLFVDFPELNGRLLRRAHYPVAWVAPPQAWAWRPWRARAVRRASWVGCLFEFSAAWYRDRGVETEWIGHPLADRPPLPPPTAAGLALLPGSRDPAVARLLPIMLAAVDRLGARPLTLAVAPTVDPALIRRLVGPRPIRLCASVREALASAAGALVGAGTATLEVALAGRPAVTLADLRPMAAAVARRLVRSPSVSLPNLVLGRRVWPECVLDGCTPSAVATAARGLADTDWSPAIAELRRRTRRAGGPGVVADRVDGLIRVGR